MRLMNRLPDFFGKPDEKNSFCINKMGILFADIKKTIIFALVSKYNYKNEKDICLYYGVMREFVSHILVWVIFI
jgi:hypothetical protein